MSRYLEISKRIQFLRSELKTSYNKEMHEELILLDRQIKKVNKMIPHSTMGAGNYESDFSVRKVFKELKSKFHK